LPGLIGAPARRAAAPAARAQALGLLGDPRYFPEPANDPAGDHWRNGAVSRWSRARSCRRAKSGDMMDADFGQCRSEDFTVTILKRNARQFMATGLAFAAGRRVLVRGRSSGSVGD
jgi:hypothetical protein